MIPRTALSTVRRLARGFPIVALTGPRQSGKTTLARVAFPGKPYVSLENADQLAYATADTRRFLADYPDGAVIDEVQRCPELFSYLQGWVDERRRMGDFVLTGSQQFGLMSKITQSLAGTANSLREALASSNARGQWGERMAEDVLRMAGMQVKVNYFKRTSLSGDGTDASVRRRRARSKDNANRSRLTGFTTKSSASVSNAAAA